MAVGQETTFNLKFSAKSDQSLAQPNQLGLFTRLALVPNLAIYIVVRTGIQKARPRRSIFLKLSRL